MSNQVKQSNGISYSIIATDVNVAEGSVLQTYGISCSKEGKAIETIEDISTERSDVEQMVERFNSTNLPPEFFRYVVEGEVDK